MNAKETERLQQAETEIVDLHRFFEAWMNGILPESEEAFARFADVMDDGFEIVHPDGHLQLLPELTRRLWGAHGLYDQKHPIQIWIDGFRFRLSAGPLTLATYEEWQQTGDGTRGRLSTVLFRDDPAAPNGLRWVHVHEVWLPAP